MAEFNHNRSRAVCLHDTVLLLAKVDQKNRKRDGHKHSQHYCGVFDQLFSIWGETQRNFGSWDYFYCAWDDFNHHGDEKAKEDTHPDSTAIEKLNDIKYLLIYQHSPQYCLLLIIKI